MRDVGVGVKRILKELEKLRGAIGQRIKMISRDFDGKCVTILLENGDSLELSARHFPPRLHLEWCSNDRKALTREFIKVFAESMRLASLNNWADECHKLAVARGKYTEGWDYRSGWKQVLDELFEWLHEMNAGNGVAAEQEYGDVLSAWLSIGKHLGYDIDAALAGAMERNRERAKEDA